MKKALRFGLLGLTLLAAQAVQAQSVIGYDAVNVRPSGYGNWDHVYTGNISDNGDDTVNYSGGGGTLNDGYLPSDQHNNQLFSIDDESVLTLHFSDKLYFSEIDILAGYPSGNVIPGTITGFTVTLGGVSVALQSTGSGPGCAKLWCNGVLFGGTALAGVATDTISLSKFTGGYSNYFSAGEITAHGIPDMPAPVPEPETYAMLLAGLSLLGFMARPRKHNRGARRGAKRGRTA